MSVQEVVKFFSVTPLLLATEKLCINVGRFKMSYFFKNCIFEATANIRVACNGENYTAYNSGNLWRDYDNIYLTII